jgi:hypothetical protein
LLAIVAAPPFFYGAVFSAQKIRSAISKSGMRPIARQNIEVAHDLIAEPRTPWRIMRNGISTLKIRVKRRLRFWWHRPAVSFLM